MYLLKMRRVVRPAPLTPLGFRLSRQVYEGIQYHFVLERILNTKDVKTCRVSSVDILVDILTKLMLEEKYEAMVESFGCLVCLYCGRLAICRSCLEPLKAAGKLLEPIGGCLCPLGTIEGFEGSGEMKVLLGGSFVYLSRSKSTDQSRCIQHLYCPTLPTGYVYTQAASKRTVIFQRLKQSPAGYPS